MITIQQTRGRDIEEIKPELVPVRGQMIIDTAERNFKVGDGETDLLMLPWWLHKPPKEVDGGVVELLYPDGIDVDINEIELHKYAHFDGRTAVKLADVSVSINYFTTSCEADSDYDNTDYDIRYVYYATAGNSLAMSDAGGYFLRVYLMENGRIPKIYADSIGNTSGIAEIDKVTSGIRNTSRSGFKEIKKWKQTIGTGYRPFGSLGISNYSTSYDSTFGKITGAAYDDNNNYWPRFCNVPIGSYPFYLGCAPDSDKGFRGRIGAVYINDYNWITKTSNKFNNFATPAIYKGINGIYCYSNGKFYTPYKGAITISD